MSFFCHFLFFSGKKEQIPPAFFVFTGSIIRFLLLSFYVHTLFCPEIFLKGGARILIEITSIKKAA